MSREPRLPSSLFRRDGDHLVPSALARGPWYEGTLHGSAMLAAVAWTAERHPSDVPRQVVRLTVDLMRAAPLAPLRTESSTVRAGKNLDFVDARLFAGDELVVRGSALRVRVDDVVVAPEPTEPPPRPPDPGDLSPVPFFEHAEPAVPGFHDAIDLHPDPHEPTPLVWFRLTTPVVDGEPTSGFVTVATLCDWTYAVPTLVGRIRAEDEADDPDERATFAINADTTVSTHRPLVGDWVGLRTRSHLGDLGAGVSGAEIFDADGPLGFSSQSILIRGAAGAHVMLKETR